MDSPLPVLKNVRTSWDKRQFLDNFGDVTTLNFIKTDRQEQHVGGSSMIESYPSHGTEHEFRLQ